MTKSTRLAGLEAARGVPTDHRPKRAKTFHDVEDQILGNLDRMLGAIPMRQPTPPLKRLVESSGHKGSEPVQPSSAIASIDFKVVPRDPSLQALWVAREIKKFAVQNQDHTDRSTLGSESTTSPVSQMFMNETQGFSNGYRNETPDTSMNNSRYSGRKRRQTSKAKDLHLVDIDTDDELSRLDGERRGQRLLATLLDDPLIEYSLSSSPVYGPDNFLKRQTCGKLFMESMAAITMPPDHRPAAKLKEALWRSRNNTPFVNALQILASFDKAVHAIDVAFKGRLDPSTPLTYANHSPDGNAQFNGNFRVKDEIDTEVRPGIAVRPKRRTQLRGGKYLKRATVPKAPVIPSPAFSPALALENPAGPEFLLQAYDERSFETSFGTAEPVSESEGPPTPEPTRPEFFTPVDPVQSAKAAVALKGATAVLDDMAYGALKFYFMPHANGPFNNQYLTPYGPPAPGSYVTPYANPSTGQDQEAMANRAAPQQVPGLPQPSISDAAQEPKPQEVFVPLEQTTSEEQTAVPQAPHDVVHDAGKARAREQVPGPDDVIESTETEKDVVEEPKSTLEASKAKGDGGDDEYTQAQIDSFLALANVDSDSDSDVETDRDKTISREMTPVAPPSGDLALESIVRGIIGELTSNQNWGHGIGFLTPQTHLYQIHNAQRFAEGLRKYIDDAMPRVNCIVTAEQGHAQSNFYEALVKRITNPYLDGTLPHYSNVVFHNGRAYQAIPGPAHPMYQQQLPYPPPPPPTSQLIIPAHGQLPMTRSISSARPYSSSQPSSAKAPIRIREYRKPPPVSRTNASRRVRKPLRPKAKDIENIQTSPPALQIASSSEQGSGELREPLKSRELSWLHDYGISEGDHSPVALKKRKRRSGTED